MIDKISKRFIRQRAFMLGLCLFAIAALPSCSSNQDKAFKTVEQYLKSNGVRDVKLDFFYTDPAAPDRAYISVTATHDFATAEGKLQEEYLGYILKQSGQFWRIEKNTEYTKEKQKAQELLTATS